MISDKIFSCSYCDPILPAMKFMREMNYSHCPILENGVVIGVFSESTIMSFIIDHPETRIDESIKFSDLKDYIRIKNRKAESFRFVSRKTLISEINIIFDEAVERQDRIGLIFVTQNGKETEKLLGILSAWDVARIQ